MIKGRTAILCAAGFGILSSLPLILMRSGLVLNYSDSVPHTFLLRTSDPIAQYAVFCAPLTVNADILKASVADMTQGHCPGNMMPLLKPIVEASPEHPLELDANGISIDSKALPNTAPKSASKQGIPLVHYPFGVYTSGLWPISTATPDSYDARYFGPITSADILYRARPLF
jgi:conjugative transfer signal peptidase TraF